MFLDNTCSSEMTHPLIAHDCYNIECRCYLGLPQLWYVITDINDYDVD